MQKYIQLQDSYDSKKGDIWKELYNPYMRETFTLFENTRTLDRLEEKQLSNKDWFAPYEEKKEYSKTWEDLKKISGSCTDNWSNVVGTLVLDATYQHKNVYATENQAKAARAEAQLSQLLKEIYEGEEWKPVWDGTAESYCITLFDGVIEVTTWSSNAMWIALPNKKLAKQFLKNHRELIETYFKKYEW